MKPGWLAALALVVVLAGAEVVRPTTIPRKMLGHPSFRAAGRLVLTQEQLEDLPPIDRLAIGNIDALHAVAGGAARSLVSGGRLERSEHFEITGWCADPEAEAPGAGLVAIVDGSRRIDVGDSYGSRRADVVKTFGNAQLGSVGFDIRLPAAELGAGPHAIRIAVIARDGRGIFVFPTVVRTKVAP